MNAALSLGLQLLSRYRLQSRYTENFGQGRLPCASIQLSNGRTASSALQPACLILVTDGACLRQSPDSGGGTLQLQYGSQPLREFYKEPFRWDQRIFCLAVGDAMDSGQYLHPQLRALVDVTGGSHWMVRSPTALPTDAILKRIRPFLTKELPLTDPLFVRMPPINYMSQANAPPASHRMPTGASFVNAGPIICLQAFEGDETGKPAMQRRAMLLYTASSATNTVVQMPLQLGYEPKAIVSQPLWCIPESFFPSKKLDSLPPRAAQPLLFYSKYPGNLGSKSFEPMQIIKMLHTLDQLTLANRKLMHQPARCLHRDVYICEWLSPDTGKPIQVSISSHNEYFPVFCRGAGRPTLSDDADTYLNIGILHAPMNSSTLASQAGSNCLATLTLLPPEPHILLPLLVRAAEAEHRVLKKMEGKTISNNKLNVLLDDHWRSEFRAYLFRLPPYYQNSLKWSLRTVLPTSAHALLHAENMESLALQCFSNTCLQKIRNGEQIARDTNERLERQEASLRRIHLQQPLDSSPRHLDDKIQAVRYGNYDTRASIDSYIETLRSLPPPWRVQHAVRKDETTKLQEMKSDTASQIGEANAGLSRSVVDVLGDLPSQCLMAYYESRRRWIFGGPSLTTRGLHVEGVSNGGSNKQRCGSKYSEREECLLSVAGVGVSALNETSTARMGDYKERLVFSRSPIVGYGSNDTAGVSATTAADGSPVWSVDDDAMPITFFDSKTGEFSDSMHARSLSKILVNFGNPFREKRADSIIPEKFLSQAPSMQQGGIAGSIPGSPRTPPGSPPHSSFDSVEEGEAIFVTRTSPSRCSPKRDEPEDPEPAPLSKRPRTESMDERAQPVDDVSVVVAANTLPVTPRPPAPTKPVTAPQPPRPQGSVTPSTPIVSSSASKQPAPPKVAQKKGPPAVSRPPPPPPKPTGGLPKTTPPVPQTDVGKPQPPPITLPETAVNLLQPSSDTTAAVVPETKDVPTTVPEPDQYSSSVAADPSSDTSNAQLDLESPGKKPEVTLPAGWICVWSKSQKRWYFFDTKTNKSLWKWPPDS